jgi:hypothetical protein
MLGSVSASTVVGGVTSIRRLRRRDASNGNRRLALMCREAGIASSRLPIKGRAPAL